MQLTSPSSTIEALQNVDESKWVSEILSEAVKEHIVQKTAGPETICNMIVTDFDKNTIFEYNEIVDLKTTFFLLAKDLDPEDVSANEYPSLRELYKLAFAHP